MRAGTSHAPAPKLAASERDRNSRFRSYYRADWPPNQGGGLMFLRNNEKIDTEILRDRILLEINELKRQMTDGPAAGAVLGNSGFALQELPQRHASEAKLAPPFIQLIRRISTWMWCFVHLPRVYTTADSTKSRLSSCEQQIGILHGQVQRLNRY